MHEELRDQVTSFKITCCNFYGSTSVLSWVVVVIMFDELFTQSMQGGHRLLMKQNIRHNVHASKNLNCGNFLDF